MVHDPPSFLVAKTLVAALCQCGVQHFCICPGSRSTPLALSVWLEATCHFSVHHDERCAGFFALGKALATRCPVAIITTSGTAVAELLPAVVEAYQSQVPLIVLTADRPAALRGTGANQTIVQPGIFGIYVKAELDLAIPPEPLSFVEALKQEVCALHALSIDDNPGPVHLNIQFEPPFEPVAMTPYTALDHEEKRGDQVHGSWCRQDLEIAAKLLSRARQGLIIVGPNQYPTAFATAVCKLAQAWGLPILADPLSGLRHTDPDHQYIVTGYDTLLQAHLLDDLRCDLILRFGALPVSRHLIQYMDAHHAAHCPHVYVSASAQIHDEAGSVTHRLSSHPLPFCERLAVYTSASSQPTTWLQRWQTLSHSVIATMANLEDTRPAWDGTYVASLLNCLSAHSILFAGNSLPIRVLDLIGHAPRLKCRVYGNRGASGIDGLVSTSLGMAHDTQAPVCLLIGDLSLLHDVGGLAAVRHLGIHNFVVVVLNNQGGGIFERLPVARLDQAFEELFIAAHTISFAHLAAAFGLVYRQATTPRQLTEAVTHGFASSRAHLVEVITDRRKDWHQTHQFIQQVKERYIHEQS